MHNQPIIQPLARSQLPHSHPPHSHANQHTSQMNPPSITFSSYILSDQINRQHYDPQGLTNALRAAMQMNTMQVSLRMALCRSGGGKVYLVAMRAIASASNTCSELHFMARVFKALTSGRAAFAREVEEMEKSNIRHGVTGAHRTVGGEFDLLLYPSSFLLYYRKSFLFLEICTQSLRLGRPHCYLIVYKYIYNVSYIFNIYRTPTTTAATVAISANPDPAQNSTCRIVAMFVMPVYFVEGQVVRYRRRGWEKLLSSREGPQQCSTSPTITTTIATMTMTTIVIPWPHAAFCIPKSTLNPQHLLLLHQQVEVDVTH
ncbi:hypothetical protein BDZ97DRAFT_1912889 [Flammula alnicola]|nr:hypothetical protein BDZ97DRAFT_1912889 [Flammula alnicola]